MTKAESSGVYEAVSMGNEDQTAPAQYQIYRDWRQRFFYALALILLLLSTVLILVKRNRTRIDLSGLQEGSICDPFALPGSLQFPLGRPEEAHWHPIHSECRSTNWIDTFRDRNLERLSPFKNATILVLGDSVDRDAVENLAKLLDREGDRHRVSYADITKDSYGWDERGVPWPLYFPELNFTITNGFFYGMDDDTDSGFSSTTDWHAPGLVEQRIDELFKVHTDQLAAPPSFISLHSGLWDLALFGRQDKAASRSTDAPLSQTQIDWWMSRMNSTIDRLRKVYPDIPIWFRMLHRVGKTDGTNDYRQWSKEPDRWDADGKEKNFDFFTNLRSSQIRAMQRAICAERGIPIYDFGTIWEGQQMFQDKVHPMTHPGGYAIMEPLLHHFWMETQGRENWERRIPV